MRQRNLKPIEVGQRFGRLKYVEEYGFNDKGRRLARFACDCGNEKIATVDHVRHGITKSCGCLPRSNRNKKIRSVVAVKEIEEPQTQEGFFNVDDYFKSDYILNS